MQPTPRIIGCAVLSSISAFGFAILVQQPIWHLHDDSYYSMIAGGFGIADSPTAAIPFMHPLIGQLCLAINQVVGPWAYSALLFGLIIASLAGVQHIALITGLEWQRRGLLLLLAVPMFWSPQYTIVSAWLAMCGLISWCWAIQTKHPHGTSSKTAHLLLACIWLFLSMLLRREMTLLCIFVASPLLLWSFLTKNREKWQQLKLFSIACAIISLIYYSSEQMLLTPSMEGFLLTHSQRVPYVDYGLMRLVLDNGVALPPGVTRNGLELFDKWFFADNNLFPAELQNALVRSISWTMRLQAGLSTWATHIATFHQSSYFPVFLTLALAAGLTFRHSKLTSFSVILFLIADTVFALLGRPIPDRVALGLLLGLWASVLLPYSLNTGKILNGGCDGTVDLKIPVLALAGIITCIAQTYRDNRNDLGYSDGKLWQSFGINSQDTIYFMPGGLRLRSEFRPLFPTGVSGGHPPQLIPLATFYNHPATIRREQLLPCGNFMNCLKSGQPVRVFARPDSIAALSRYIAEQEDLELHVQRYVNKTGNHFYELTTESIQPKRERASSVAPIAGKV